MSALEAARRIVALADHMREEPSDDAWLPHNETPNARKNRYSMACYDYGEDIARAYITACEALEEIAQQEMPEDMSVDRQLDADFVGACGLMIKAARVAISCSAPQPETGGSIAPTLPSPAPPEDKQGADTNL